jgi:hypothetical protein
METILRSLGDPVELAETYWTENRMIQAECAGSPLVILYVFGYANVVTVWTAAIEKLFASSRIGLWYTPGSFWPLQLVTTVESPPARRSCWAGGWSRLLS